MKKIDELKGPSCLTAAADDEPLFVLRANDELAPSIVLDWALEYAKSKRANNTFTAERQKKFDEAVAISVAMRKWKDAQR